MSEKKRYVQVGMGGRSQMFSKAMLGDFAEFCDFRAICDTCQGRMDYWNSEFKKEYDRTLPTYKADQFEQMIAEHKPDTVVVTTGPDVTHSDYIVRAMELGCDVITEKPMTTDEHRCRKIIETMNRTGQKLRVTFNYRYSPPRSQMKEILAAGEIGEILSVDFCWLLDTRHGADYFRRWHRRRENSGSLLVHKATHHFDLVNWWLDDVPEEVFCQASRCYYTPRRADALGLQDRSARCKTCPAKDRCKFYLDLSETERHRALYLETEEECGYYRDRCVFDENINIWDTMSVTSQYQQGTILNFMLHAYSPYEGYKIAFNGTKGRIEHHACENTYISGDGSSPGELAKRNTTITLIPEFSSAQEIEVRTGKGGHGGGDPILLRDLFDPNAPNDPLNRAAGVRGGSYSILLGVAAYRSIDADAPIKVSDLLDGAEFPEE